LRDESFKENLSLVAKKEFHHDGIIYKRNEFADGDAKSFQDPLDYTRSDFWLKFDPVKKINCIVLKELIEKGQRIKEATLYLLRGADVVRQIHLSTVGHRRIITFPAEEVSAIRFVINDAKGPPLLSEIETYFVNENLIEK
jgi:alpha-L-fucosidase